MAIRIPISVRSWVCSHPNIHTCMILFVSLGVFSLCMFRERKHGSLNRGNCLVGITGLEPGAIERVRSPPRLRSHWDCGGTQSPTSAYKNATHHKVSRKISPMKQEYPYQSELSLVHLRCSSTMLARGAMQDPLSRALPASSPCMTFALLRSTRGAIHIKPYITRQTKFSCISGKWPLLSKGLRGGKSRRLRVESLLRWMIASEDAKNPLKARKQKRIQGYGLLYPPERKG